MKRSLKVHKKVVKEKLAQPAAADTKFTKVYNFKRAPAPAHGKEVWITRYECENANYTSLKQYLNTKIPKIRAVYPGALLKINVKYASIANDFIGAKYQSIDDDLEIHTPYDYMEENDPIEGFYISIAY